MIADYFAFAAGTSNDTAGRSAGPRRCFVPCSNANANLINVRSVHAVPKKLTATASPATAPRGAGAAHRGERTAG